MRKRLQSGRLDRRIRITETTSMRNETGEQIEGKAIVFDGVPADVIHLNGTERYERGVEAVDVDTLFVIRFRKGVNTLQKVEYDGKEYDVLDVGEMREGRLQWLKIAGKARQQP